MKGMFKHRDGSLKTGRVALAVFIAVLISMGVLHKVGKSKQMVLLQADHLFKTTPLEVSVKQVKNEKQVLPNQQEANQSLPQKTAELKKDLESKPNPMEATQKPETVKEQPMAPLESKQTSVAKVKKTKPAPKPVKPEPKPQLKQAKVPKKIKAKKKVDTTTDRFPALGSKMAERQTKSIELASPAYFELYSQWRKSGLNVKKEDTLISLRIRDLESVYKLFQMKVVAMKNKVPFFDLTDISRVAPASLNGYSSTCFVVNQPWEKWGKALSKSGFSNNNPVEVRYYTYAFVRNAIYARAMAAFKWSVAKQGLSEDTKPGDADVLGRVYALKKESGGSFGVFVPDRVDFKSGQSVVIDPLDCFGNAPDVLALHQAGIL